MSEAPQEERLPPSLRLLKWLVIVLTLTMIGGVITIVGLIVTRLPQVIDRAPSTSSAPSAPSALPALPASIALPPGETPAATTFGPGWIAVVTEAGRILVFDAQGRLLQEIAVTLP